MSQRLGRTGARLALVLLACGIAASAPWPGTAQTLPSALPPLLITAEHRAALLDAAKAVDGPGMPTCADANYATTGEVGILAPVKSDPSGRVVSGSWKETIQETGCGSTRLLNAVTSVQPNGSLRTQALLPGTTIADPQLQQDSVPYAATAMGALPAGCDDGGVVNTRFVGLDGRPPGTRPEPGGAPRPWTEIWTLAACGRQADIIMHFRPDATGTDVSADLAKQ